MIRVEVNPPHIAGDSVTFSWHADPDPGVQLTNQVSWRYPGIDLTQFSTELWWEIFLAIQLRPWSLLTERVHLHFSSPVPKQSLRFWSAYYQIDPDRVTVSSICDIDHWSPFEAGRNFGPSGYDAAIYFGGGRDSLATACLLGDFYGRDRVLLISVADPFRHDSQQRDRAEKRVNDLLLKDANESLGFAVQSASSDLQQLLPALLRGKRRWHLEQYTVPMLPILLDANIPFSTFCAGWFEYYIAETAAGLRFQKRTSRPEILAAQSDHFQRSMGFEHTVGNVNMLLTGSSAFTLLHRHYPDAFPFMAMCIDAQPGQRWCYRCAKCARYAWQLLADQVDDLRFDMNQALTRPPWNEDILKSLAIVTGPIGPGQNAPWDPKVWNPTNSIGISDVFARADPTYAQTRLDSAAWFTFLTIKSMLGNLYQPVFHTVPAASFQTLPGNMARGLRPMIEQVATIVPEQTEPLVTSQGRAWGPFTHPFDHPVLHV